MTARAVTHWWDGCVTQGKPVPCPPPCEDDGAARTALRPCHETANTSCSCVKLPRAVRTVPLPEWRRCEDGAAALAVRALIIRRFSRVVCRVSDWSCDGGGGEEERRAAASAQTNLPLQQRQSPSPARPAAPGQQCHGPSGREARRQTRYNAEQPAATQQSRSPS